MNEPNLDQASDDGQPAVRLPWSPPTLTLLAVEDAEANIAINTDGARNS